MTAVPNPLAGYPSDATGADSILAAPAPVADPSPAIAQLNGLLRGEISAAETYRGVLEKLDDAAHADQREPLSRVQAEHARSCLLLRERIVDLGGTPADSSGVWGIWAQTVQSTLTLIGGEVGSLRALREGEEHGQRDYEAALNAVDAPSAQLIQDRLLPAQQQHLETLDKLLQITQAGV